MLAATTPRNLHGRIGVDEPPSTTHRSTALLRRAEAAQTAGLYRRALDISTMALNERPTPTLESRLRELRSSAWAGLGSFDAAANELRHALRIAAEAGPQRHASLGRYLLLARRFEEAATCLQDAVELEPDNLEFLVLLGEALEKSRRHADAHNAYQRAHELSPADPGLAVSLAQARMAMGHHAEAARLLELTLKRDPNHLDALIALAGSSHARGQNELSASLSRRALALDGTRADAHMNLAVSLLRSGEYPEGFREYEWRLAAAGGARRFGLVPWDGRELSGETLVLFAEQGLGDTLQFVRYVRNALRRGTRTVLVAPARLHRLLSQCTGIDRLEVQGLQCPAGHCYSMLMSLPHLLGLSPSAHSAEPYLSPEPERVATWRERLAARAPAFGVLARPLRVGLVWQGNPDYAGDAERSLPFSSLQPLLRQAGEQVIFVSLQRGFGAEQVCGIHDDRLIVLGEQLDAEAAFIDSAAVISMLDLVITTDTALAHLSGALGARTWLLLNFAAEWRWGTQPFSTPWYPSMRLFRQTTAGDWNGVLAEVGRALAVLTRG